MYLSDITETFLDFPDNHSIAVIVFLEGCIHNCKGCQNPLLQNTRIEDFVNKENLVSKILNYCKRSGTDKVVLSGGDPFYNKRDCMYVIDKLVESNIQVCVYTGYDINKVEEFYSSSKFNKPQYLKCGSYREDLKVTDYGKTEEKFVLVSSNQKFYKLEDNEYKLISDENVLYF